MMATQVNAGQIITAADLNALDAQRQIETITLDSNTATITFTNIPQELLHLHVVLAVRHTDTGNYRNLLARFNGDTGQNYHYLRWGWMGDGNTPVNYNGTISFMSVGWIGWDEWSLVNVSIPCYSVSGRVKLAAGWGLATGPIGSTSADGAVHQAGGKWDGTNPVTEIEFSSSGDFVSGSVATLYGRP